MIFRPAGNLGGADDPYPVYAELIKKINGRVHHIEVPLVEVHLYHYDEASLFT